ncbi:hypothetical protein scyTo_0006930 [Scyliorhinus torazame]|uniref:Dynein axonemal light chain 4 n=1 Tax=Scyliorhinus torazame TaxID=75743 RepID=A0A401NIS1_SCYTO|nr:hypothetical protein [Scyliorhinus torazame]
MSSLMLLDYVMAHYNKLVFGRAYAEPEVKKEDADSRQIQTFPIVRYCDMLEEMMKLCVTACEKFSANNETAAKMIEETMDKRFGVSWHVVAGEGFEVTHEMKNILYMYFRATWPCVCGSAHNTKDCSGPSDADSPHPSDPDLSLDTTAQRTQSSRCDGSDLKQTSCSLKRRKAFLLDSAGTGTEEYF